MSRKRYVVDSAKLKRRRRESGLSLTALVKQVEDRFNQGHDAKISRRYLIYLEKDNRVISEAIVNTLTLVLGCDSGDIVATSVADLHEGPILPFRLAKKLDQAVSDDLAGNAASAVSVCGEVLNSISRESQPDSYVAILVRMMSFLDHAGQHGQAISMGDAYLAWHSSDCGQNVADVRWVEYQLAINLRRNSRQYRDKEKRLACLIRAEDLLKSHMNTTELKTAVGHQIGVVLLERFWLGPRRDELLLQARSQFSKARKEWSRYGDHRVAFAERRLGQVHAELGNLKKSLDCFHRALATFAWNRCQRDIDATVRDLNSFVIDRMSPKL